MQAGEGLASIICKDQKVTNEQTNKQTNKQ